MILEIFVCGILQNNTILLGDETKKEAMVIDPAFDSFDRIQKYVQKHSLKLIGILITHSHYDHIANVKKFKEFYQIPIYVHGEDAFALENPDNLGIVGMPRVQKVKSDRLLKDHDHINIGHLDVEVLHTPGHTPGGICFYLPKENLLISGDTLFKGAFGRIDLPGADEEKMWQSLKALSILPSNTRVIPGHGPETTIGKESWLKNPERFF